MNTLKTTTKVMERIYKHKKLRDIKQYTYMSSYKLRQNPFHVTECALSECGVIQIGDNLYYINELPENLVIEKTFNLWLFDGIIHKLPNKLTVHGNLILTNCFRMKYLPKKLVVDGVIYVSEGQLSHIPKYLEEKIRLSRY